MKHSEMPGQIAWRKFQTAMEHFGPKNPRTRMAEMAYSECVLEDIRIERQKFHLVLKGKSTQHSRGEGKR